MSVIDKSQLENAILFELINADSLGIQPEVADFLLRQKYPWQVLGEPLRQFIRQLVDAVPPSKRIAGEVSPHAVLEGDDIVICEGAVVEPHTYISGPTYIAPGAAVRQGAYVRGSVYAGKGAVIGHTSEAKGALLLPQAKAAHFAYVGDSILGANCNLGAGTKLANLRFDHKPINIRVGTEIIATGLKKFGAILGNHAQTGCNSVTNPGTVLLPHAFLLPNKTGHGIIVAQLKPTI